MLTDCRRMELTSQPDIGNSITSFLSQKAWLAPVRTEVLLAQLVLTQFVWIVERAPRAFVSMWSIL